MIRTMKALGGLLLATMLVACGGGGGSAGVTAGGNNNNPPGGGGATAATVDVFTSAGQLNSAPNSSVTFSVTVKDANNQALANQPVSFAASSGAIVGPANTSTGPNGEAVTSVSLTPGGDQTNRNIVVTVTSGGASRQVTIPVTGTTITLSGASSTLVGGTTLFTVTVRDSSGQALTNPVPVSISSTLNNGRNPATGTTTNGVFTFVYTGTNAGTDTVTATAGGTSASTSVLVSALNLAFVTPTANASLATGTSTAVTVRWLNGGAPVVGQTVTFSTTRGTVSTVTTLTNGAGDATTNVSSTSAGPATITANTASGQIQLQVNFVAQTAATLVLQANPSSVAPNQGGATTNRATLSAQVRDASGNAVAGQNVAFTATTDPSGGQITPATAVTDASGVATAQFIPGGASSPTNGVVISATVQSNGVTGTTSLTVNQSALFISIFTGNQISNRNQTTYEKQFAVLVTDANGAAVANKQVTLSVFPTSYRKGRLVYSATASAWVYDTGVTQCANEDLDRDGTLDPGEDVNGNGSLQPGIPVTVDVGTVTTDSTGTAVFNLLYGENYVPWVVVDISARATVSGTESVKVQTYDIRGAADDFSDQNVPPAGVVSPFGTATACTNPN